MAAVFVLLPPDHAYVPPPVAVRLTLVHAVAVPVIAAVAAGFTVTVKVVGVPVQPATPALMKLPKEKGVDPTVIAEPITVFVDVLITETVLLPPFTTYTRDPSGDTDTP